MKDYMHDRRVTLLLVSVVALLAVGVGLALGHLGWGLVGGLLPIAFGTIQTDNDIVRVLSSAGILDAAAGMKRTVVPKTANYTILSPATSAAGDPSGTIFTNRGAAGTVIFTLPAATLALKGVFYEFMGIADFTMTVAPPVADTLLVLNDIAADSLSVSTAGALIGAHMTAICDGVAWVVFGDAVGVTFTVAT